MNERLYSSTEDSIVWNEDIAAELRLVVESLSWKRSRDPCPWYLIHSEVGGGKTTLLRSIQANHPKNTFYVDLNDTMFKERSVSEIFDFFSNLFNSSESVHSTLLLDNIDSLLIHPSTCSQEYLYLTSAIIGLIDEAKYNNSVQVISSLSSMQRIHPAIIQPYRFNTIIELSPPNVHTRRAFFQGALSNASIFSLGKSRNLQAAEIEMLYEELTSRMQGSSYSELNYLIHSARLDSYLSNKDSSVLIEETLLNRIVKSRSHSNNIIDTYLVHFDRDPEYVGYDFILDSIQESLFSTSAYLTQSSSGVLIAGPSGIGKTALVHKLAFNNKKYFKFASISCADLVHKVVGESEKRIADLFTAARKIAPCILLLDSIDIIIGTDEENNQRTAHKATDRILSTLLIEIDGIASTSRIYRPETNSTMNAYDASRPVVVFATTQSIHTIDRALRRPGRLEDHVIIDLPSYSQRQDIAKHYISKIGFNGDEPSNSLSAKVASITENRTVSSIRQLIQETAMTSLRRCIESQDNRSNLLTTFESLLLNTNSNE